MRGLLGFGQPVSLSICLRKRPVSCEVQFGSLLAFTAKHPCDLMQRTNATYMTVLSQAQTNQIKKKDRVNTYGEEL